MRQESMWGTARITLPCDQTEIPNRYDGLSVLPQTCTVWRTGRKAVEGRRGHAVDRSLLDSALRNSGRTWRMRHTAKAFHAGRTQNPGARLVPARAAERCR